MEECFSEPSDKYKKTQYLTNNKHQKQQIYNQQKYSKSHKNYILYKGKIVNINQENKAINT